MRLRYILAAYGAGPVLGRAEADTLYTKCSPDRVHLYGKHRQYHYPKVHGAGLYTSRLPR
jgi:hypothetical protein